MGNAVSRVGPKPLSGQWIDDFTEMSSQDALRLMAVEEVRYSARGCHYGGVLTRGNDKAREGI